MSSESFPTFRCIPAQSFKRTPRFNTEIQAAQDGSELRIDWGGYRWRYEFTVRAISPGEIASLTGFFVARRGRWDTFFFADPTDGVQRLVRFDSDSLEGVQIVPGMMDYPVTLISVVVP